MIRYIVICDGFKCLRDRRRVLSKKKVTIVNELGKSWNVCYQQEKPLRTKKDCVIGIRAMSTPPSFKTVGGRIS